MWQRASIYRDEWGTPHVYGDDYASLAFAFGYAQAEDHLEAMLMAYRVANGRAAEIFGESYADSDEFSLKMGHAVLARKAFAEIDPLTRDVCDGFATGVNAWLVEHADRAPAWAEGVRPEDILALMHCYLMSYAPFDLPNTWHRPPASFSGNAWAVGPACSETGEPILVINPHTAYDGPFQWYEAHLSCQDMNVAGATLFGLPVILQGHNDVLGWALTPNQPDFADVYMEPPIGDDSENDDKANQIDKEKISPQRLLQMLVLSSSRTYYVNTPEGPVARAVPCVDTPTGPLIGSHRGLLCAYKIGGYRDFGAMAQLVEMARARDLPEFQSALAMQQMPCFHVLYADRGGNISYLYNVKVGNKAGFELPPPNPRKRGENDANDEPETPPALLEWNLPVPAGRPVFRWGDIVPAEMLPGVTNPKSGYLQACGTPPWAVTDDCAIKQENLPRWFAWDRDTFRAQRVRKLLAMGKRSFRDCQSMLYDVAAPFAMEAVPVLVKTAESRKDALAALHPDLPLMIDTLKTWNYTAENNSTGMTLFHAWWSAMRGQDLTAFGNEEGLYAALRDNAPEAQDLALNAAADAARLMRNDFQTLTVPWGEVHTIRRGAKEVAVAGAASGEPIFTESDYVYEGRKWHATYGYAFAMVVSFGAKTTAVSMTPFGASESAASPHYADQLDLLTERRLKVTRFRPEEIQRYASSARGRVLYLRPRGCEALVTLNTPAVVEARLVSFPEAAEKLPDGLVPFTLFMGLEQAPADTPAEARLEVFVPPVLCAGENLKELGLYGCTAGQQWTRLESQELNEEARTLSGHDARTFTKFVVLGPQQFLAQRLVIPGQKTSAQPPSPFTTPIEAKAPVIPMPPRAPEQPAPESNPVVITNTPQDGEPGTKLQGEKKPVVITNVPGAGGAQGGKTSVIITNIPDGDKAAGPTGIRKITPGTPPKENDTRQGVLVPSQKEAQEPGVGQMRQTPTMDGQPLPEIEFLPQPEPEKAQPDKKQKPKKEPFFSKFGHKKKKSGPAAKRNYGINKKKASN